MSKLAARLVAVVALGACTAQNRAVLVDSATTDSIVSVNAEKRESRQETVNPPDNRESIHKEPRPGDFKYPERKPIKAPVPPPRSSDP
ncbi:MAG: hypothetical protein H7Z74_03625 [Anaerolineae bacterium]|nr:hypothetical protein [Gemmatimonadaceae bacterium]